MSWGPLELIVVLAIVLLLFGAGRLPKIMKDLGRGVTSFKEGVKDGDSSEDSQKEAK